MSEVPLTPAEADAAAEAVAKAVTSAMHDVMQKVIDNRPPDVDTPNKQYTSICRRGLDLARSKVK